MKTASAALVFLCPLSVRLIPDNGPQCGHTDTSATRQEPTHATQQTCPPPEAERAVGDRKLAPLATGP
jgi:hypothetical protein